MANPEHVALAWQGRDAIDRWRQANEGMRLDLSAADLVSLHLPDANLAGADLSHAELSESFLEDADLSEANLAEAHLTEVFLAGARLAGANLSGARMRLAILQKADLADADLTRADLAMANMAFANLARAKLCEANLLSADLLLANLSHADLTGANVTGAKLHTTVVSRCRLSYATIGATTIANTDLTEAADLDTVRHQYPSSVGVDTLIRSFREGGSRLTADLRAFFLSAGVPLALLEALPAILAEVEYNTCFICYGSPDLEFAQTLRKDLTAKGVSCWLYDMDATVGERTWSEIAASRREAKKMVLVCSAGALVREGVLKEIEEQIDEDPDKLVPISLDDLWTAPGFKVMRGSRDLKPFLLDRNYADFAKRHYPAAFDRLLAGLKRRTRPKRQKER